MTTRFLPLRGVPLLLALGAAAWAAAIWWAPLEARARSEAAPSARWTAAAVYRIGGLICHQDARRSFHVDGVQLPVCARCAGLYLALPFGCLLAARAGAAISRRQALTMLAAGSAPTALIWAAEAAGALQPSGVVRAAAAVPLSIAVAWVVTLSTTACAAGPSGRGQVLC